MLKISENNILALSEIPLYPYYGQTKELAVKSLEKIKIFIQPLKSPNSYEEILNIIEKIKNILYKNNNYKKEYNNVISGINCALLDMLCKKLNVSIIRFIKKNFFLKSSGNFPISSYTIGLDTPSKIAKKINEANLQKIFKIKLGSSFEQNCNIINTIKALSKLPLRIDANCGWNKKLFFRMLNFLQDKNIEFIEQPLTPIYYNLYTKKDYLEIFKNSNIPIILDESIIDLDDIEKHHDICSGVNLKISKCGGISNTMAMIEKTKEYKIFTMLGCMIESSLGINYALNLSPFVDFLDLDGNILIKNDPYKGKGNFENQNGKIFQINDFPGIGISK